MASKVLVALVSILVVVVAVIFYYATLPVPPGLSSSDNKTLRMFAFLIAIGAQVEKVNLEIGVHVTNFLLAIQGNLIPDNPSVTFTDTTFDNVKVRVYEPVKPDQTGTRAGLIYLHGGGWVVGDRKSYHILTEDLAVEIGDVVLISIDYRLAWEAPFPASIDDVTDATIWLFENAVKYNVDPQRIAVAGDSAGGNLAAALCQRLTFDEKYKDLPKMKFQGLVYPALQAFDLDLPSYQQNSKEMATLILTKYGMADFYSIYIQGDYGLTTHMMANNHTSATAKQSSLAATFLSHEMIPDEFKDGCHPPSLKHGDEEVYDKIKNVLLDPDFSPLMRHDLQGLPPAYVITAQYDVLRDDGILYAKRLSDAGVDVTWRHYNPSVHAMFYLIKDPLALESGKQAYAEFVSYARDKLKTEK
ncbi:neutral cholesterol ester hydrolase 1-like [Amphiura filiformis]|uniref:neutral cholesterol ester hydrolase 1-like n=1 Tax=Amphiura filiformis TaxID=82378 RepID=UPI003B21BB05